MSSYNHSPTTEHKLNLISARLAAHSKNTKSTAEASIDDNERRRRQQVRKIESQLCYNPSKNRYFVLAMKSIETQKEGSPQKETTTIVSQTEVLSNGQKVPRYNCSVTGTNQRRLLKQKNRFLRSSFDRKSDQKTLQQNKKQPPQLEISTQKVPNLSELKDAQSLQLKSQLNRRRFQNKGSIFFESKKPVKPFDRRSLSSSIGAPQNERGSPSRDRNILESPQKVSEASPVKKGPVSHSITDVIFYESRQQKNEDYCLEGTKLVRKEKYEAHQKKKQERNSLLEKAATIRLKSSTRELREKRKKREIENKAPPLVPLGQSPVRMNTMSSKDGKGLKRQESSEAVLHSKESTRGSYEKTANRNKGTSRPSSGVTSLKKRLGTVASSHGSGLFMQIPYLRQQQMLKNQQSFAEKVCLETAHSPRPSTNGQQHKQRPRSSYVFSKKPTLTKAGGERGELSTAALPLRISRESTLHEVSLKEDSPPRWIGNQGSPHKRIPSLGNNVRSSPSLRFKSGLGHHRFATGMQSYEAYGQMEPPSTIMDDNNDSLKRSGSLDLVQIMPTTDRDSEDEEQTHRQPAWVGLQVKTKEYQDLEMAKFKNEEEQLLKIEKLEFSGSPAKKRRIKTKGYFEDDMKYVDLKPERRDRIWMCRANPSIIKQIRKSQANDLEKMQIRRQSTKLMSEMVLRSLRK